jgi:hypothetical protein
MRQSFLGERWIRAPLDIAQFGWHNAEMLESEVAVLWQEFFKGDVYLFPGG